MVLISAIGKGNWIMVKEVEYIVLSNIQENFGINSENLKNFYNSIFSFHYVTLLCVL